MSKGQKKAVVLLAEENDQDFFLINKLFLDLGSLYLVKRVQGLQELREQMKNAPYDILFLDIRLPQMRSEEKIEAFLKEFPHVPVILLTEIEDDALFMRWIKTGAQEVLTKRDLTASLVKRVIRHAIERKQTEYRLREVNKLKTDLISQVSHELRSPLTYIKDSLNTVLSEETGPLGEDQKRFLTMTQKGIDNLHLTLNDMLDASKIEAGKLKLHLEEVDFTELVDEVASLFYKQFMDKGLSLTVTHAVKHVILPIDRHRITQVLTNLLGNAYKFTDQGSVNITVVEHEDVVECTVTDTGCGIAKEDIPHLFQSFSQFGQANHKKIKGTGLGLKISQDLVELHNGEMHVESKLNEGTSFTFSLPKKMMT